MIGAALARLWDRLGGPDPGPVDFAALTRRRSGNDALAAPAGAPGPAPDLATPTLPVPAARLAAIVERVARAEGAERLPVEGRRLRYRARTPLMRFPDLVDVEVVPMGEGASTLRLYSRSLVGRKDFGANRARLRRWLTRIEQEAGPPRP